MGNTDADIDKMNNEFDPTTEAFRRFWKIGGPRSAGFGQGDTYASMGTNLDSIAAESRKKASRRVGSVAGLQDQPFTSINANAGSEINPDLNKPQGEE